MKPSPTILPAANARLRVVVCGAVQGVGFRPFIYRLANELELSGWVKNSAQGVTIEIEGSRQALEQFPRRLADERPPRSFIQSCEATWLDAVGYDGFVIRDSENSGNKSALVLPDIATCPDCVREIFDPTNRRHRYPFTNCTNCGPRFSLIESLPYDRANTSMRKFQMCAACQAEYDDPNNRRFHAQPNACPVCGPTIELWPGAPEVTKGKPPRRLAFGHDALLAAAHVIRCGQIVAVKGVGGFHLFVDARNEAAVRRLRERKHREEKPFALLFPTLASVKEVCEVSPLEERLLGSPEAPIVLLRRIRNPQSAIPDCVAPVNPNLGVMLPSNPLHHLLMAELGFPVVATSGNLSDEPICTDELEASERLRSIADVFLVHNRPIVRPMDDSIVCVMAGREMVLRRARGFAPLPVTLKSEIRNPKSNIILAFGAHLKNSVALAVGDQVFLSQHLGDLETEPAHQAFGQAVDDLPRLYDAKPEVIAGDLHPDYLSTQFALAASWIAPAERSDDGAFGEKREQLTAKAASRSACRRSPKLVRVQHHIAHTLACLAENEVKLPALGVAWDGTGLGTDGTIWGGEFFLVTDQAVERIAHWRPFRLPGGDAAAKEPRRAALGLLHELAAGNDETLLHMQQSLGSAPVPNKLRTMEMMLTRGLNAPWCGSVGRLFDAVAALVGLRQEMCFEGQAAMELEFAAEGAVTDAAYEVGIAAAPAPSTEDGSKSEIQKPKSAMVLDWARMIELLLADVQRGVSISEISAKFHNTLVEAIVSVASKVGCERVALSGGCFQNRYLTERTVMRLRKEGFQPYWHQRVPPNDGGIALGQVVAARRELAARGAAFPPLQRPESGTCSYPSASPPAILKRTEVRAPLAPSRAELISRLTQHASR